MDQAEKLRNVVKIKNQNHKPNARVITITSGKGGAGKSNIAVNLAVQLKKMGKRVLIFDADFGLANVEVQQYDTSSKRCPVFPEATCNFSGSDTPYAIVFF